mgnify:CR=1 FL=1
MANAKDEHIHDSDPCCECGNAEHCCCDCPRYMGCDSAVDADCTIHVDHYFVPNA